MLISKLNHKYILSEITVLQSLTLEVHSMIMILNLAVAAENVCARSLVSI